MSGVFITFEGIEGCGKSTQLELLAAHLEKAGHAVLVTREPGGTDLGESIRQLLLDPDNGAMAPLTELLLYEAARAQLVSERIRPALEAGQVVLCDRFYDSTTAYQGAGRRLRGVDLAALHGLATGRLTPDLTILLDLPVDEGLRRALKGAKGDRIERESLAFHERVRRAFMDVAKHEPNRVRVLNGLRKPEDLGEEIARLADAVIASGGDGGS